MLAAAQPRCATALDVALDGALARAVAPLALCRDGLVRSLAGLEPVDLPPLASDPRDLDALQLAAPLYLAAQLEAAGLVVGAETVAGLVAAGGLGPGLTEEAATQAVDFWRQRRERLAAEEREAFFEHIFGGLPGLHPATGAQNDDFELGLINLADAVVRAAAPLAGSGGPAAVCVAGRNLGALLLDRTSGLPSAVAADLVAVVHSSLALLRQPSVLALVGARTTWGGLQALLRRYRREERPVALYVGIGRDGVALLGWVARGWPELAVGGCSAGTAATDELVVASTSWLRTALSLHESAPPVPPSRPGSSAALSSAALVG